ncbi:DUF924 family protein [Pontibaca salina]|uniref:DUF924 domain-containing protein n=1 Tax=Pontibaca salina TaxID=2795731 RepID=A0A934LZS0_9RHOB|nr:DUF924 family protein [Pontibaca salina]MBI6628978.1 DUF924 domain-containing protein [Pontibaca salina]
MVGPEDVLRFWLEEAGESRWYEQNAAFDREVRDRFETLWWEAHNELRGDWMIDARGKLAFIIVTDQFPRNMFRGSGQAFATDRLALAAAKLAIAKGWDRQIGEPERQFFYMPLMHSENLSDQDRCVRLIFDRMPKTGSSNMLHARAHREVIREFGRFPYRNEALGRATTREEAEYLRAGGYGTTVKKLKQIA